MNKKSKEIVKKLCFTLVVVISIITIIGCPNTVSNKANGTDNKKPNPPPPSNNNQDDENDWSGLTADQVINNLKPNDKIIYSLKGFGFGRKDNKICLSYGKVGDLEGTPKLLSEAAKEVKDEIGTLDYYPNSYDNIQDGLEKRWIAAKETLDSKDGSAKWLEEVTLYNSLLAPEYFPIEKVRLTYGRSISITDLAFAVDVNEGKLFAISGASGGGYKLFADWHVVFVEKASSEMYSFHYGPYTLKGDFDENNPKVPVGHDKKVHVFTLSEMLKDYLTQKKHVSQNVADQLVTTYFLNDTNKYNVYLVLGKISLVGSSDPYICYRFVHRSFRNVLKLNDNVFWGKCWNP